MNTTTSTNDTAADNSNAVDKTIVFLSAASTTSGPRSPGRSPTPGSPTARTSPSSA